MSDCNVSVLTKIGVLTVKISVLKYGLLASLPIDNQYQHQT